MANFCPRCGGGVNLNDAFCHSCGAPLSVGYGVGGNANPYAAGAPLPNETTIPDGATVGPGFWGAFGYCMKHYADFKGRATRTEFWGWSIVSSLVGGVLGGVVGGVMGAQGCSLSAIAATACLLGSIFWLPGIAVAARRLHDMGAGGAWYLPYWGLNLVCSLAPIYANQVILAFAPVGDGPLAWFGCAMCYASLVVGLALGLVSGTKGANRFGAQRLNPSDVYRYAQR